MIRIRPMTTADLPLGMRLKQQAGWNQTLADWQRILQLEPEGCFVAEYAGQPVGTATTCLFDSVAWIAMVLVDEPFRGRGIGSRLMEHVLDYLNHRQVSTIRLDATPLGRRVYQKLGFVCQYDLTRWEGMLPAAASALPDGLTLGQLLPEQFEEFCALDRLVTGTNRRRLLEKLFAEAPTRFGIVRRSELVLGYWASRPGAKATQIGPVLAHAPHFAGEVIRAAVSAFAGQYVFIDIPVVNLAAAAQAAQWLKPQRNLTRMYRGRPVADRTELLCASFGPEKG